MSTDIKLHKTRTAKIIQSGAFLGALLTKIADPLMKVAIPLVKNTLARTAAASAIDAGIQNIYIYIIYI